MDGGTRVSSRIGGRRSNSPQGSTNTPKNTTLKVSLNTDEKKTHGPLFDLPHEGRRMSIPVVRRQTNCRKQVQSSGFTKSVARMVDGLRGDAIQDRYKDVWKIFDDIRKQFDDVKGEADKRDVELSKLRREIRLVENESEAIPAEKAEYASITLQGLQQKLRDVDKEVGSALEKKWVYEHLAARLRKENGIVQEKISVLEDQLRRKTHDVDKRQVHCRRLHQEKVACVEEIEHIEEEVEMERQACAIAANDLENAVRIKRSEVNHREEFERWRYEIALDAATSAFQSTAGRYRKIYAIEKLTGNCLQKITFEQAEQSQTTEDGFQKIREVTGLTDVMDIVTKFLNRDQEHDQLRIAVREAEVKLNALREAEFSWQMGRDTAYDFDGILVSERGFFNEYDSQAHAMVQAQRDYEELQAKVRKNSLFTDDLYRWVKSMSRSFAAVDELPKCEVQPDIIPYFEALYEVVDKFLTNIFADVPAPKIAKLTGQAGSREHNEQLKLLVDKEFARSNVRVPASLDAKTLMEERRRGAANTNEEERYEVELAVERDRIKGGRPFVPER